MNTMLKMLYISALGFALCVPAVPAVSAGELKIQDDGGSVWQATVDGVEIEWNADGSIKRIYSRYSTPVEFADRRGIYKAQVIAEEKAKAGIIRFMDQAVSSTRLVTELQADISKATQLRQTGAASNVTKTDERTMVESLVEVTASFASGNLRGVIVLERGYSETREEAWVVVGISKKTIAAASAVEDLTDSEPSQDKAETSGSITTQSDEVRRSSQTNW